MSVSASDRKLLNSNLPPVGQTDKEWDFNQLFSSGTSGPNTGTFHSACDNKGPLLMIATFGDGLRVAGYMSSGMNSTGQWVNDPKAFLLVLADPQNQVPASTKLTPTAGSGSAHAYFAHPSYGPTFGGGHDFQTFLNNSMNFSASASTYAGHGGFHQRCMSSWNNTMSLTVEVFSITIRQKPALMLAQPFSHSWLKKDIDFAKAAQDTMARLRSFASEEREALNLPFVNVLLCGEAGAGKSSWLNTLGTCCNGRFMDYQRTERSSSSVTRTLEKLFTSHLPQKRLPFCFWDTMGLSPTTIDGFLRNLDMILSGMVAAGTPLDQPLNAKELMSKSKQPKFPDQVHYVCLVVSATDLSDTAYCDRLKRVASAVASSDPRHAPYVGAVVTHIDQFLPDLQSTDGLKTLFHNGELNALLNRAADNLGLNRNAVFPVKCYSSEHEINHVVNTIALLALEDMASRIDGWLCSILMKGLHE
jgi:hypothetical protein